MIMFITLACLYDLLETDNEVFKTYAALCVSHIAQDRFDGSQVNLVLNVHGLMEKMIDLLDDEVTSISASTTIRHVIAGTDKQAQRALDLDILPRLVHFFDSTLLTSRKRRVIGWILSNVAAGTPSKIELLFGTEGISEILFKIANSDECIVRCVRYTFFNILF
ncbi:unnamed protein product [Enterobius vermicularis]|uniref:HEAT repeat-containing protein 1 n=1 Tax=Enterobius vermicularis TaxID=51028 RepID=A0A0N4VQX6_ENTVE|nr:unnamed protein product [Enterobius vermicularis]